MSGCGDEKKGGLPVHPEPGTAAEPPPGSGWERRFIADADRASEAIEIYTALGFEVLTIPMRPEEMAGECRECGVGPVPGYKTIYIRKAQ